MEKQKPVSHGTFEAVYVGMRRWSDKKYKKSWLKINPDGTVNEGTFHEYGNKNSVYGAQPGTIVRFHWANAEHSSYWSGGEFTPAIMRTWRNIEDIARWQTSDRAANEQRYNEQQEKKRVNGINRDELGARLKPISQAYQRLSKAQRRAFLAWVIGEIVDGG